MHEWRGKPFANDHLDAFFNAAVDAGIALGAFIAAAEAAGVGCCPVSVIRDHAAEISELLGLPDHVFPVCGLGLGWPERPGWTSLRLPLTHTVHRDRFDEKGLARGGRDLRRSGGTAWRPIARSATSSGTAKADFYGWSEDKARQYAVPQRTDWGAFVEAQRLQAGLGPDGKTESAGKDPGLCPCGSGKAYDACCAIHHGGMPAPTAEALMRSRYVAFVLRLEDLSLRDLACDARGRRASGSCNEDPPPTWLGLDVKRRTTDGDTATVEFVANYRLGGGSVDPHARDQPLRARGRPLVLRRRRPSFEVA